VDIKIGLCNCNPPCGRIATTGWLCKKDRSMHIGKYSFPEFIDILISHETIHYVIYNLEGLETTKRFNLIFDITRNVRVKDLSRKGCLKVIREDGTPNIKLKRYIFVKIKRWFKCLH